MKTWIKVGLPVLLVVAAVLYFSSRWSFTVMVSPATRGTAVNAVTGTVEVLAGIDMRIRSQSRGQLMESMVKPGQVVEKGDVLFVQDSEQLQLQVEHTRIRLEAAREKATLESVHKIELERIDEELEGLELAVELKQAPLSKVKDARRLRRKSEVLWKLEEIGLGENVKLLENQLEQYALQVERMETRAPFAGVVAEVFAWEGDMLNANQNLIRLVSHGRTVLMKLTEEDYFGVKDKQPVTLRLASYPDRTFDGRVIRLEDIANSSNKTRNLFVRVHAPDNILVPGLTGEGYLVKDERTNAIMIPRRALIGNLVYVVANGKVEVRRVQPGFLGLHLAEILDGIEEGELVILEEQNLLKPGQRVKPVTVQ